MRIALAQMNSHLGNFQKNKQKLVSLAVEAKDKGCDLVVFPELALLGYHPFDLLERPSVLHNQNQAIQELLQELPKDIHCLIGAITENQGRGKAYHNSVLLIENAKIKQVFHKELLPVYDVFDDSRHFSPGQVSDNSFELKGQRIQVLICEDMWGWDTKHECNPLESLEAKNIDLIVSINASPFTLNKRNQRQEFAQKTTDHLKAPLVYVNMVGAQDELIFDGGSFALSDKKDLVCQSAFFNEDLNIFDLDKLYGGVRKTPSEDIEYMHQALVLGIRDFIKKIGFKKAHLGLSGGIDSAVVACLIADAIGPQNLTCIALPSRFNNPISYSLAKELCENIHCEFYETSIQEGFETLMKSYEKTFGDKEFSLMHENLQSRIRGLLLMAYSNETGSMLVTTGNKSEYATGYATIYGDMCGGLAPIADLLKKQVYDLAHYYNRQAEVIPNEIITRPPSAELREDQKDSDSLPDYDALDDSVNKLVCERKTASTDLDKWVLSQLYRSEFKRWQAPPILKISDHAFGRGRRMPIAHK